MRTPIEFESHPRPGIAVDPEIAAKVERQLAAGIKGGKTDVAAAADAVRSLEAQSRTPFTEAHHEFAFETYLVLAAKIRAGKYTPPATTTTVA